MPETACRVLLLSPGCRVNQGLSFGHPHLVALGSYLQTHFSCRVYIADLDYEKHLPPSSRLNIFSREFDLIGISCYSSFEYLKSYYLAVEIRKKLPQVCLVVGGYHPSACPGDFMKKDTPFDYVVRGEGEKPLGRIVSALCRGDRLPSALLEPDPVEELDSLPPMDWPLLARYRALAHRLTNEVTVYLSRGCVFQCSFCMEAAKGKRSWRAFSPARGEQELLNLHRWLDLSGKNLFISDPLFGFSLDWRREMLSRMRRLNLPVESVWALSRADLLQAEDFPLLKAARFGLGFGLETGDPGMLQLIHKGGDAASYLEKFIQLAHQAAAREVPWGANIITGHPGETVTSLRNSAVWLNELFSDPSSLSGFLSVDPYRFYPGSPVAENISDYEQRYATRVYNKCWWDYSDPEFTSQWIDPSRELNFRQKNKLTAELFLPLLNRIAAKYGYAGYAADYFRRSTTSQIKYLAPDQRLHIIKCHYLWLDLQGEKTANPAADHEVQDLLKQERASSLKSIQKEYGQLPGLHYKALLEVPREQFVRNREIWLSGEDRSLSLLQDHSSTISALHAYALNYRLLNLKPGDYFMEIGGGTGYGAALASVIVGPGGKVQSLEIEEDLVKQGMSHLTAYPQATMRHTGQVNLTAAIQEGFTKILYCYALTTLPLISRSLTPGVKILAPLMKPDGQQVMTLLEGTNTGNKISEHMYVKYVSDKTVTPPARATTKPHPSGN